VTETTTVAAATRPRIRIQEAIKDFSGRVVVDIDDLTLGEYPIEGLIGPNGAGKTTLMRMIMHSTALNRGQITLLPGDGDGSRSVVLSELPTHQMARFGVVKSNQVIMDFEKLTIWDSLLLAVASAADERPHRIFSEGRLFRQHEDEMRRYLEFFSFSDFCGRANSAGEKKLLDIVRCLLLKPKFLLLDEPTAGLPEGLTERVMEVIRGLAEAGTSVVVVEHDLNVIWNLCDQVHFMAEGKVLMRGEPRAIRENKVVIEKYLGEGHVGG
jgi:ABC-type branched-subunit amino acid transport system ATPase component